jgi:hypothetical protein
MRYMTLCLHRKDLAWRGRRFILPKSLRRKDRFGQCAAQQKQAGPVDGSSARLGVYNHLIQKRLFASIN